MNSNILDKGQDDRIFDKELMKPLGVLYSAEGNTGENAFSTWEERGGYQGTYFEQSMVIVIVNHRDDTVDNVLRDYH